MRMRLYLNSGLETEPPILVEMRSPPETGDLFDSEQYGPCEVVDVISTPADRCQDALIVLRRSAKFDVQG
jgi:hypothetical protein